MTFVNEAAGRGSPFWLMLFAKLFGANVSVHGHGALVIVADVSSESIAICYLGGREFPGNCDPDGLSIQCMVGCAQEIRSLEDVRRAVLGDTNVVRAPRCEVIRRTPGIRAEAVITERSLKRFLSPLMVRNKASSHPNPTTGCAPDTSN